MGNLRHVYWLCGLSALLLAGDFFCWNRISEQIAAIHYRPASGQITRFQIIPPVAGEPGPAHTEVSFGYTYCVNGRGYAGAIYSYVQADPPPEISLPHGKLLTVFYNPNTPADAVLSRELTADDFGKIAQLVLLNLMAFSLLTLWARWRVRINFSSQTIWQS